MKTTKTYVLVADGGQAKIYLNEGVKKGLHLIEAGEFTNELHKNRELDNDKAGRGSHYVSAGNKHTMNQADHHESEKIEFAHQLAEFLNIEVNNKKYERLIIAAPPKILPEIKKKLNHKASSTLMGELNKDLTKISELDLPHHFREVTAF